ncbi:MAG: KEOPS complex N(6)-L-threonylcarbamoyladenine synthase Kae1 [archaeon GB-1867-097]|nr:KEOPS complex N(6)-L-threonylcarbamoyladenine synthase Kae1 [Candidatus Culexmicrobium thermophilum]MCS7384723.1 KEOPS complex N(6)-L-threonylcarbamoyladenine synthase Kae1 [Candidatus Culexmicrobium thermophilum]RLE55547.1 MAG: bifunctional N(6)-L-threonylcarbamoyladenine synthase/serine/threonine protein kinase [Candidatus Verstraetearchaeota archaeon]HDO21161.1 N(6)-L-threonylcarbamoyladenine synthase Kae1 [Candidatus Bathyarchaeota archaeon]
MIVLGIECTAHTFGCGIVDSDGHVLANVNSEYVPITGGIHPREAARHHSSIAPKVLAEAFKKSDISMDDVDGIAVSLGPGLGPCLRTGATVARALAAYYDKPLIPVNHCVAHIEIAKMICKSLDPLVVYISGGNTIVAAFSSGRYRIFGETLDIALGNCLDVFAREAGLSHPGGPHIERLALKGNRYIQLPYVVKGQDVSFSGLLTAAIRRLKEGYRLEDLCFSLQETAFSMICEVAERALSHTMKHELLLTGGVAANKRLRSMLSKVAELHEATFKPVPLQYARDNGAMIAWTGILGLQFGLILNVEKSYVRPRWRLDSVDIPWFREGFP